MRFNPEPPVIVVDVPKLIWRVDPAPTGPYRSFQKRGWPHAYYQGILHQPCARIECKHPYTPAEAKSGQHPELTIYIADYSVNNWQWRRLTRRCATINGAKMVVRHFLSNHPAYMPTNLPRETV